MEITSNLALFNANKSNTNHNSTFKSSMLTMLDTNKPLNNDNFESKDKNINSKPTFKNIALLVGLILTALVIGICIPASPILEGIVKLMRAKK